ncbi:MYXO-CTERM sorting domain-containing protein [Nannocystaceae bacterium ST9]
MRRTLGLVAALALTSVALLSPREAEACSCMTSKDALTAARDSSVVFEGKLVAVESPKPGKPTDLPMKIFTFDVARTFKGQLDSQVRVQTTDNSAACGRDYGKPGDTWLIYARTDDQGQLHDNLCSRTTAIADAAADIAELEANRDSLDQPNPQPEPEGDTVAPSDEEPKPIEPAGDSGQPEPVEPSKKGCSIGEESSPIGALALLGLLALPWSRSRRRR